MGWCLSDSNKAMSDEENKAAVRSNSYYKVIICVLRTVFVTLWHFQKWNEMKICFFFLEKCKISRLQCFALSNWIKLYLWNNIDNLCMQQHGNCMNVPEIIHITDQQIHKEKKHAIFSSLEILLLHKSYLYLNQQFCLSSFRIRPWGNPTPWLSKSLVSSAVVFQSYSQ